MRDKGMSDEELDQIMADMDRIPTGDQIDRMVERLTQELDKMAIEDCGKPSITLPMHPSAIHFYGIFRNTTMSNGTVWRPMPD